MPTLYIDCSATMTSVISTGIQRVVRNIARYAPELAGKYGYDVKLVALRNGDFVEISLHQFQSPKIGVRWQDRLAQRTRRLGLSWIDALRLRLSALSAAPAWHDFIHAPRYRFGLAQCVAFPISLFAALLSLLRLTRRVEPQQPLWLTTADLSNDLLLLADSTWGVVDIWPAATRFKQQGGYISTVVYDLIALSHPQFFQPALTQAFARWINGSVACTDYYIGISRSTEIALKEFLRTAQGSGQTGYFHLGSDLDLRQAESPPRKSISAIVANNPSVFLVVGSLEPRKNLGFVIDAFERLWQLGSSPRLVLVGHNTWKAEALIETIQRHPLLGKSLFWINDATDADLDFLYKNATALIFASIVEGFGLPVVEAMQRGLPVMCSDIPVLREIADGKAQFFSLASTDELAQSVEEAMAERTSLSQPKRTNYAWLSWRESTDHLLKNIHRQFKVDRDNRSTATDNVVN